MEQVIKFIVELFFTNGLIIAVAAYVVGEILKGFKKIPKNIIPLVGGILGIVLGISIPNLFEGKDIITSGIFYLCH